MGIKMKLFMMSLIPHQSLAKLRGLKIFVNSSERLLIYPSHLYMYYDHIVNTYKNEYPTCENEYPIDYTRYRTLELLAEQISTNNVKGDAAEAGVAYGDFAFMINRCFPDRSLYLYDTFEGFDARDVSHDLTESYVSEKYYMESLSTYYNHNRKDVFNSIKGKMKYPDNCIFRKGWFPESAVFDKDKTFAFVSLDMDLYKPTFAALEFFYPRLSEGGYIFIHDYNHSDIFGVKSAVKDFEDKFGTICKVPISDISGSLIISK